MMTVMTVIAGMRVRMIMMMIDILIGIMMLAIITTIKVMTVVMTQMTYSNYPGDELHLIQAGEIAENNELRSQ